MSKITEGLKKTGSGILSVLSATNDAIVLSKMSDVEQQIDALQEEWAGLNSQLSSELRKKTPYTSKK